jgi:hypothetical protein
MRRIEALTAMLLVAGLGAAATAGQPNFVVIEAAP